MSHLYTAPGRLTPKLSSVVVLSRGAPTIILKTRNYIATEHTYTDCSTQAHLKYHKLTTNTYNYMCLHVHGDVTYINLTVHCPEYSE